jgi:non-ribosomal peptide synthetase component E (peptide arylation enzyme)
MIFDEEKPEAYHWRMTIEHRIDNMATKDDIAELRTDVRIQIIESEARLMGKIIETNAQFDILKAEVKAQGLETKNSIIMWLVSVVIFAQLVPALVKLFIPG